MESQSDDFNKESSEEDIQSIEEISKLKKLADAGDSDAQVELACKYKIGKQVEKSEELYFHYIQLALEENNPLAMFSLGLDYEIGTESFPHS